MSRCGNLNCWHISLMPSGHLQEHESRILFADERVSRYSVRLTDRGIRVQNDPGDRSCSISVVCTRTKSEIHGDNKILIMAMCSGAVKQSRHVLEKRKRYYSLIPKVKGLVCRHRVNVDSYKMFGASRQDGARATAKSRPRRDALARTESRRNSCFDSSSRATGTIVQLSTLPTFLTSHFSLVVLHAPPTHTLLGCFRVLKKLRQVVW